MEKMSQESRRERRKQVALDIGDGRSIEIVASVYGVSEALIRSACKEFGVKIPAQTKSRKPVQQKTFDIVRDIVLGMDQSKIAEKYSVTRQYIHNVVNAMKIAGLGCLIDCDAVKRVLQGQSDTLVTMADNYQL